MGNTVAIRQRERAALDETNRALYDQVQALQDQKTLAEQTAAALQAEAQQRETLQGQLDQILGNTAAIRQRERDALTESNRALYDQVKAAEDQKAANDRATQAAQEQANAARELQRAWDGLGDTLREQVRRIRADAEAGQNLGYATLAAEFASLTAQARAGDQKAAGNLASVSQALLQRAAGSVTSRVEYQRVAALTAASLEATLAAVGQPTAASTMTMPAGGVAAATYSALTGAPASAAPMPVSAAPVPMPASATADPMATLQAEVKALREEVAALRRDNSAENIAIVRHTAAAARVLTDVAPTGTAINTRAAA